MAFDITPYIDKSPAEVRAAIRKGDIDFPTAGMSRGYAQANLVILPPEYAADFEEYAKRMTKLTEKFQHNKAELEQRRQEKLDKLPCCPICGKKDNVVRISTLNRTASVATFGLASSKIGKQYQCKHCNHLF